MSYDVNSNPDKTLPGDDRRYVASEGDGGAWQVVDTATGLPAATNGKDIVQLHQRDAEEIADELNRCDAEDGKSPLL